MAARSKPTDADAEVEYKVKLNAPFPHEAFTYLPRHGEITVNQSIYDAMKAAKVIDDGSDAS
jgi:hypothetical protein